MAVYLSPGVYVEEVPSSERPIAGVGTSTAGFIGLSAADTLQIPQRRWSNLAIGSGDGAETRFALGFAALADAGSFAVRVLTPGAGGVGAAPAAATISADATTGHGVVTLAAAPAAGTTLVGDFVQSGTATPVAAGEIRLCTGFVDFVRFFGDFSTDAGQSRLAHAVYGFFNNGGTACYVVREAAIPAITSSALVKFEAFDEIAIVAAPGITDKGVYDAITTHCKIATGDRFAIFDTPETVETGGALDIGLLDTSHAGNVLPANTDYGAIYFPWIKVADPVASLLNPTGTGQVTAPPSGHMAGIYARVDALRGVHKAPANEPVMGALDLKYLVSKGRQDLLNPHGINVIRTLNGAIRVWGARTLGGDANADLRYISTRRLLLFLRKSIDEGTQWVVFEPNDASLWARITRNITAFLTDVWHAGALFGATAGQAFYVKCDAETNPPEARAAGRVVTEIGVAIVEPAEFVVFRLSQWSGPAS